MGFELAVVGGLLALILVFYAIGKYSSAGPEQFLDWKPTRSPEVEIELELQDVQQMIEAQNERRRRDGRPLIDEDAYRNMVEMQTREEAARAEAARREREELGEKEWRRREAAKERQQQRWRDKERRGF
jgi:hypothetical protein